MSDKGLTPEQQAVRDATASPVGAKLADGTVVGETKVEAKPAEAKADLSGVAQPEAKKVEEPKAIDNKPKEPTAPIDFAKAEYKFTAPEGMALDEAKAKQFSDLARKLEVAPERAQELLNFHASELKALATQAEKANRDAWDKMQGDWKAELAAMPEFTGERAKASQILIGRVLDEFGSREARSAFDLTGAGNNPHVAKMLLNMAEALTEGGPTPQGRPKSPKADSLGSRLYGSSEQK